MTALVIMLMNMNKMMVVGMMNMKMILMIVMMTRLICWQRMTTRVWGHCPHLLGLMQLLMPVIVQGSALCTV